MKKLIGFLLVLAVVFVCAFPALAKIEVNGEGKVRIIDDNNWRPLTKAENEAFVNPGKEIPEKLRPKRLEKYDFFHISQVLGYEQVVAYIDGKFITVAKSGEVAGEKQLAVHKVLILVAMLLMAISNIALAKVKKMLTLS